MKGYVLLILAGLACLVAAAFLVYLPAGLAALGGALCFVGFLSIPGPRSPKE